MSLRKRDQDGQQQAELKKNIAKFRLIVRENCRLTVRSIAEEVNIDRETVRKILTEDGAMRKVCAKMVAKELTEERNQRRVSICQELLEGQDDILDRVITGDETWVFQYDSETKRHIAQRKTANSPRPKISVGPKKEPITVTDFLY